MQVRRRGNWIHLLKTSYHRYDELSKIGGRSTLSLVHKFPASATEVPQNIKDVLTAEELERVMNVAIIPAREEQKRRIALEAQAREASARHEIDPNWRLARAIEVMGDVSDSIQPLSPELDFDRLAEIINGCVNAGIRAASLCGESVNSVSKLLGVLAKATSEIAQHVSGTAFPGTERGSAKEGPMHVAWTQTKSAHGALLVALQKKRYAQKRNR